MRCEYFTIYIPSFETGRFHIVELGSSVRPPLDNNVSLAGRSAVHDHCGRDTAAGAGGQRPAEADGFPHRSRLHLSCYTYFNISSEYSSQFKVRGRLHCYVVTQTTLSHWQLF